MRFLSPPRKSKVPLDAWVTVGEAAKILGVKPADILDAIEMKQIKAQKVWDGFKIYHKTLMTLVYPPPTPPTPRILPPATLRKSGRTYGKRRRERIKQCALSESCTRELDELERKRTALSIRTKQKHHIDHLIPLFGKTVSGFHVPWNLKVIPARANILKGNKLHSNISVCAYPNGDGLMKGKRNGK